MRLLPASFNTLSRRITASALAGALAGAACTVLAIVVIASTVLRERFASLAPAVGSPQHARCLERPADYLVDLGAVTIRSLEYEMAAAEPSKANADSFFSLTVRRGDRPPCNVYLLRWPPPNRWPSVVAVLLAVVASISLAAILAALFAVRPLVRRVNALSLAAEKVGDATVPLQSVENELPDAVGALATALRQAHQRVLAHAQAMEDELSSVSHDLRTPLAALQLGLESGLSKPLEHGDVSAMLEDVNALVSLADNLSIVVGLRHKILRSSLSVDLTEVVRRLGRRFSRLTGRKHIAIGVSTPEFAVFVLGHPTVIEQALANLMQNAVDHGFERGHAAVVLTVQGDTFRISVEDDGPGLGDAKPARLEEALRHSQETRRVGHLGLGMAIVRAAAETCGWTMSIETRPQYDGTRIELSGRREPDAVTSAASIDTTEQSPH